MVWTGLCTFVGTADLSRTHGFYADLLGLPLFRDQGVCRIYQAYPGAYLGFCLHHPVSARDEGPLLTLLTDDVDGAYARLVDAGVTVCAPPAYNPRFGIYHFFARDPDGHRVEIQRFVDEETAR